MPVQNILRMGNPLLYERAKEVENLGSEDLYKIVNDMLDTMKDANGVGIAAPQIGISKRIIIFGFKDNPRYPYAPPVPLTVLINPIIEILSNEKENGWEGCLSVPGLRGLVPRYIKIKYSGFEFNSKQNIERVVDGFHARVVQHEMDHIDGALYPHRVEDMKKFGFEDEVFDKI